jgi:hypothetical protein
MTQKTTNNKESVYTSFLLQRMIFKSKQARRTRLSVWDYTAPSRGKAMDSGGRRAGYPLAKEQETVHD